MRKTQKYKAAAAFSILWMALPTAWPQSAKQSDAARGSPAAALVDKHAALTTALAQNQFGRPLVLESTDDANRVGGHAYAVLNFPFSAVRGELKNPAQWCEVMILHINTKYCRANAPQAGGPAATSTLKVAVGKKTPQPLPDATALEFTFNVTEDSPQYFAARLSADQGPVGTSQYGMELQAVPLGEGKTFIHLGYAYSYGTTAKIAMQTYLATVGRNKIGFTPLLASGTDGRASFVGGMRGTVERNTLRYYLAIEAFMRARQHPAPEQFDKRLHYWFDATEAFPRQLREVSKKDYLTMKKAEYERQQLPM